MSSQPVVLEGLHAVKHAVRFGARLERLLVLDRKDAVVLARSVAPDVAAVIEAKAEQVGRAEMERVASLVPRTGVVGIAQRPAQTVADLRRDAPVVLLEAPRDPGNLGACVRVAAAAQAGGVVVTGGQDPWTAAALRGSAGLHFALPVVQAEAAELGDRPLFALDPGGDPLDAVAVPDDAVLAFGTERTGLSDALKARADAVVALPMRAGVSSLNLATSVSAVLYARRLAR